MSQSVEVLRASVQKNVHALLDLRHNAAVLNVLTLLAAFTFAGGFNYLYHLVVGRVLPPADYAVVVSFIALTMTVTAPFGVMQTSASDFATQMEAAGSPGKVKYVLQRAYAGLGALAALLAGLAFVLRGWIGSLLGADSVYVPLALATSLAVTLASIILAGVIQGWRRYGAMSIARILSGAGRFLIAVPLVLVGLGLTGALAGVVFGTALMLLYQFVVVGRKLRHVDAVPARSEMRGSLGNAGYFAASRFGFAVLTSADVILAGTRFAPDVAGYYSGAATLGNILIFFVTPVYLFLFPEINTRRAHGQSTERHLFLPFVFVALCGAVFTAAYFLFPGWIVRMYYGPRYEPAAAMLGWYAFARFGGVIMALQSTYHTARHDWRYTGLVSIAALVQSGLMLFVLDDPAGYIRVMAAVAWVTAITGELWIGGILPRGKAAG